LIITQLKNQLRKKSSIHSTDLWHQANKTYTTYILHIDHLEQWTEKAGAEIMSRKMTNFSFLKAVGAIKMDKKQAICKTQCYTDNYTKRCSEKYCTHAFFGCSVHLSRPQTRGVFFLACYATSFAWTSTSFPTTVATAKADDITLCGSRRRTQTYAAKSVLDVQRSESGRYY
jgi:hypothetical protein